MLTPEPHNNNPENHKGNGRDIQQGTLVGLPPADTHRRVEFSSRPSKCAEVVTVEGNLITQEVAVIVNSWNRNLIPYWLLVTQGVSGAIKRATGTGPFKELRKFGVLPLGAARLTSAGTLPFRGIIHVAGIDHFWRSSERSVRDSVKNALTIAINERFSSIAFPAIGAGSTLKIGKWELPVWGISKSRSLHIIKEEAEKSAYEGKVVIVNFKK